MTQRIIPAVMSERQKAICAALGAAAAAREQDLRGQYPKAARVLGEEVFRLRRALDQKQAEYEDMKSLLLGNARQLHVEVERLRTENCPEVSGEPVAWLDDFGNAFPLGAVKGAGSWIDDHQRNWKPLYTTPQPDPLDAEIARLRDALAAMLDDDNHDEAKRTARAAIGRAMP